MEESSGGVQSMLSSQGSRSNGEAIRVGKVTVLALPLSSFPQDFLQGDCTKARQKLNWKPRVTFDVSVLPGVLCTCWVFTSSKSNLQGGERRGTPLCEVTWAPWDTPFLVPLPGSLLWREQTPWQWWASQCTAGPGPGLLWARPNEAPSSPSSTVGGQGARHALGHSWHAAHLSLHWGPHLSLSFLQELVREMVDADVELMRNNPNAWALAGPSRHHRTHATDATHGQHCREPPGWAAAPPCDGFIVGLPVCKRPTLFLPPPSTSSQCLFPHTSAQGQRYLGSICLLPLTGEGSYFIWKID